MHAFSNKVQLFPSPGDAPRPGLHPGLRHCKQILYQLQYKGRPRYNKLRQVAYPNAQDNGLWNEIFLSLNSGRAVFQFCYFRQINHLCTNFLICKVESKKYLWVPPIFSAAPESHWTVSRKSHSLSQTVVRRTKWDNQCKVVCTSAQSQLFLFQLQHAQSPQ